MGTQAPWKERILGLCGGGGVRERGEREAFLSSFAHAVPEYKINQAQNSPGRK